MEEEARIEIEGKGSSRGSGGPLGASSGLPEPLMVWNSFLVWKTFQRILEQMLAALAPTGLKLPHNSILTMLQNGPLSQIALATQLNTDRTTMVSLIDELEQKGLVERRRNPHDRRAHDVTLTTKGREVLEQLHTIIGNTDQELFASLSEAEIKQLRSLLLRLVQPGQSD